MSPSQLASDARAISCKSQTLHYTGSPLIMGVLNVTPDSFSDGGNFLDVDEAIAHALRMVEAGAAIIDVGGESTRPGARPVPVQEEMRRVLPVIEALAENLSVPLSVDTTKAAVAEAALKAGASIVNDITALADPGMAQLVAASKAAVVLMHMQGTPQNMQDNPRYGHVVADTVQFLKQRAAWAEEQGIERGRILIDPGIGFGKTVDHNVELMRHLNVFVCSGYPVLLGPSRKSFIGKLLDADVADRLPGTLACIAAAIEAGVQVVRVHDVCEVAHYIKMYEIVTGIGRKGV